MKNILFSFALLISMKALAIPGIHEALKNPSSTQVLKLSGEKDEAALLTKNAKHFSGLKEIIISGISDSVLMEQDLASVAACNNVHQLKIENCGITNLPGVMKMLVGINEVSISDCKKLSGDNAFLILNEMPSLKFLNYQTDHLSKLPSVFCGMKSLEKISIYNTDLSLADGYALNNSSLSSLFVCDSLSLGFGANKLVLEYGCYDKNTTREHISIMRDMLQGAAGADGEMPLPQRVQAFTRENPLIHPPLANVEVRKNIYSASAMSGGEIEYPSGTKIFIPPHAFVDANGNEIKGDVTIDYREFRDPVDILVSGIPMDYDSGGVSNHFVSAGMFEMNASVNGKEVFLAPGKNVDMKFAVVDTGDNFNFYKLDENKGWEYLNSPGKVEQDKPAAPAAEFSQGLLAFYRWNNSIRNFNWKDNDTTGFDDRFDSKNYIYCTRKTEFEEKHSKPFSKKCSYFTLEKTYHKHDTLSFRIKRNIRLKDFNNPELTAFSGVTWTTTDKINTRELRRLFHEKSNINDVRIEQDGNGFVLEFKTLAGIQRINAIPTHRIKGLPVEYKTKEENRLYKSYSRKLDSRQKRFDRSIAAIRKKALSQDQNIYMDSVSFWKKIKPQMNATEKNMSFDEWVKYYETQIPKLRKHEETFDFGNIQVTEGSAGAGHDQAAVLYQALQLSNFGVFNCDGYPPLQNPVEVAAKIDVDGKDAQPTNVYVINKDLNTSTNFFNRNGSGISIKFNSKGRNVLISIDADGKLYLTDENAFAQGKKTGGNTRYPSVLVTDQPATPEQLRDLIKGQQ